MARHSLSLAPDIALIPRLLDWIEACCAAENVAGDLVFKLALALEEAVANVIDHAFDGIAPPHRIRVRLDLDAERVAAEIVDNGHPFDPSAEPHSDVTLPLDEREIGGLGIHLMRHMMDRVSYHRHRGYNHLRLEKARH
jgi:serine/threonine-protein kinase RsbW